MPHLTTERTLTVPYLQVADAILTAGTSLADEVDDTLVIRAGATQISRPVALEMSTPYRVKTDSVEMVGFDVRISDAMQESRFPIVTGDVAAVASNGGTVLGAGGWYRPPFGLLGAAADGLLLRGVGRGPVLALLEQLLDAIESRAKLAAALEQT